MNRLAAIFHKWRKNAFGILGIVAVVSLFSALSGYALEVIADDNSEIIQNSILNNPQSLRYVGGEIVAGSAAFTVDRLKYGRHADFERLVFCINDTLSADSIYLPSIRPPRYGFALSAEKTRAEVRISAYNSKVDEAQLNSVADSELIAKVEEVKFCDWRWYFISFKQPVDIEVFDLADPGRIVLDITPKE